MAKDPRCEWLAGKSAKYNALSQKIVEKYLGEVCAKRGNGLSLCAGDYDFLSTVASAAQGNISMAQIARTLSVNPSSATRRAKNLLKCGLISKSDDETDDRRYFIALTDEGRAFCEEMDICLLDVTRTMYSTVTEEEMSRVFSFMEKCIVNLQKILDEKN